MGPLAAGIFSALFHRASFPLEKDACEFRCIEYPDGLPVQTREGQPFLAFNGIQTQSAACLDLLDQAGELAAMGVEALRVSPQSQNTLQAVAALDQIRRGLPLQPVAPPEGIDRCNGYWYGRAGIDYLENLS